ncbi:hypothetical protein [Mycolicibacterium septicum]|uniref:hypothetical protein n=1 Tax=Mycolicibacterium septicum TaxID=98668 RepID=UPI001AF9EBDD|nr:hypothetical protein [Mycolicibacterium septicum]QRY51747.1 hypothetical protein JVX95_30975 [Mycolicibacterium septicum]
MSSHHFTRFDEGASGDYLTLFIGNAAIIQCGHYRDERGEYAPTKAEARTIANKLLEWADS